MILKNTNDENIQVELYPLGEPDEDKTFTVKVSWEQEQKKVKLQVIRHEYDHEGEIFKGIFERAYKDGDSCERIKVNIPCGCNSTNDELIINIDTKEPAKDETIRYTEKFQGTSLYSSTMKLNSRDVLGRIMEKICKKKLNCRKYKPGEFCLDCPKKFWEQI